MSTSTFDRAAAFDAANSAMRLPVQGLIRYPIPELEQAQVEAVGTSGSTKYYIRHPYFGVNSWIRCMPEAGSAVTVQRRGDINLMDISGYVANDAGYKLARAKDKKILFRQLMPGEIEFMTPKRAYMHFSAGGDIELRGGTIRTELLQTQLEHTSIAPTFKRRLFLHKNSKIAHEERFGVVKRPDSSKPNTFQSYSRLSNDEFAVEYSRWLNRENGDLLVSIQEGDVIDGKGKTKKSGNKALRYEKIIAHSSSGDLKYQITDGLDIYIKNSSDARETKIDLGNQNALSLRCDSLSFDVNTTGSLSFNTSTNIRSPKVNVNSPNIGFGAAPVNPAVLGTELTGTILTPLIGAVITYLTVYSQDQVLVNLTPGTVSAANACVNALNQILPLLPKILSLEVKLTL